MYFEYVSFCAKEFEIQRDRERAQGQVKGERERQRRIVCLETVDDFPFDSCEFYYVCIYRLKSN